MLQNAGLAGLVLGLLSWFAAPVAASDQTIAIAPHEKALTFARTFEGGMPTRLLLVSRYEDGMVAGIDLSHALGRPVYEPAILFNTLGYQAILDALKIISPDAVISVPAHTLGIPVGLGGLHIAAGANFPEHADDATVEDGPFLFAKAVHPSGPYADIQAGDALLDYEAELCFVPMRDFPAVQGTDAMGLILCNDVTDRALLLRKLDVFDIESGQGFADGKSKPGYLPVGNLFVIPAELDSFVEAVTLRLWVDDELRQHAVMPRAVWELDEILRQAEAKKDHVWSYGDGQIALPFKNGRVPARAMILSGTPAGTVFHGIRTGHQMGGLIDWLLGGWDRPLQQWVVDRYIAEERAAGRYLKAGDTVVMAVDELGVLKNSVVP